MISVAAVDTLCPRAKDAAMMKREILPIARIYVPAKRRGTLDPKKVQEIAESILQVGQQIPILVRRDGERFVLVEGLHRLEACKHLGEETIIGYLVQARQH
jgi:ParB-like chromosome segregation protein Spo0J